MGTRITVELTHDDPDIARQGIDAVMREMHRIDDSMSPYIETSELAILNRQAAQQAVSVSEELFELIRNALRFPS